MIDTRATGLSIIGEIYCHDRRRSVSAVRHLYNGGHSFLPGMPVETNGFPQQLVQRRLLALFRSWLLEKVYGTRHVESFLPNGYAPS